MLIRIRDLKSARIWRVGGVIREFADPLSGSGRISGEEGVEGGHYEGVEAKSKEVEICSSDLQHIQ